MTVTRSTSWLMRRVSTVLIAPPAVRGITSLSLTFYQPQIQTRKETKTMAKEFKGARLRGIRALRGITQQSLAEKLNRSQTYISHCENSRLAPTEGDIWALSRILNCSPEQLLEDIEVKG